MPPIKKAPYKKLPGTYTKTIMQAITDLAAKGLSRQAVLRSLSGQIDNMAFTRYKECLTAYLTGRDILAARIAEDIVAASCTSYMDRKLLSEKLNLFTSGFELPEIKSVPSALKAIATVAELYAKGHVTDTQAQTIAKLAGQYVELNSQTELRKEVNEIKKMLKDRK